VVILEVVVIRVVVVFLEPAPCLGRGAIRRVVNVEWKAPLVELLPFNGIIASSGACREALGFLDHLEGRR